MLKQIKQLLMLSLVILNANQINCMEFAELDKERESSLVEAFMAGKLTAFNGDHASKNYIEFKDFQDPSKDYRLYITKAKEILKVIDDMGYDYSSQNLVTPILGKLYSTQNNIAKINILKNLNTDDIFELQLIRFYDFMSSNDIVKENGLRLINKDPELQITEIQLISENRNDLKRAFNENNPNAINKACKQQLHPIKFLSIREFISHIIKNLENNEDYKNTSYYDYIRYQLVLSGNIEMAALLSSNKIKVVVTNLSL